MTFEPKKRGQDVSAEPNLHDGTPRPGPPTPRNPPAINVPGIVIATIAVLLAVHLIRDYALSPSADFQLLVDFAFFSGCYGFVQDVCSVRPALADFWQPVTHAFLHGDGMHLATNAVWLLAFGTPVARRLGAARFVLFFVAGAASGAALFYVLNPQLLQPMIGASGSVSAMMGAACRFAFRPAGRFAGGAAANAPRLSIAACLTDRTIVFFIAIFFATNLFLGSGFGGALGGGGIAWEAHLGGFAFGFLALAFFDRRPPLLREAA